MFILEEWLWLALSLTAVTLAATFRSLTWLWVTLSAMIVGSIVWYDPSVPNLHQITMFGLITLVFMTLEQFFYKPSQAKPEEEQPIVKAYNPSRVVNQTFILTEPIVDGFGQIEIDGVLWRVRGEDMPAGSKIFVRGVDGLQRDVLIVVKPE